MSQIFRCRLLLICLSVIAVVTTTSGCNLADEQADLECTEDIDCDDGVCDDEKWECIECDGDSDCPGDQLCQHSSCVSGCDDLDCGDGGECAEDDDGFVSCACDEGYALDREGLCIECDCEIENGTAACDEDGDCHIGACDDGFQSIDDDPETGCECATEDVPDPEEFTDENCDGIDGDASIAIFVSTDGDNFNGGTADDPVETIQRGIQMAVDSDDHHHVYVAGGEYEEDELAVSVGISVFGGYEDTGDDTWQRSGEEETIITGTSFEVIDTEEPIELQLLTVDATDESGMPGVIVDNNFADITLNHLSVETDGADAVYATEQGSRLDILSSNLTSTDGGDGIFADEYQGTIGIIDTDIATGEGGHGIHTIDLDDSITIDGVDITTGDGGDGIHTTGTESSIDLHDLDIFTGDDGHGIRIDNQTGSVELTESTIATGERGHGYYSTDTAESTTLTDVEITTGQRGDGLRVVDEQQTLSLTDIDIATGPGGYGITVRNLAQDSEWSGLTIDAGDGVTEEVDGQPVAGNSIGIWVDGNDGHIDMEEIDIETGQGMHGNDGASGDNGASGSDGLHGTRGGYTDDGSGGLSQSGQSCDHSPSTDSSGAGGDGGDGGTGYGEDGDSGSQGVNGGSGGDPGDEDGEDGEDGADGESGSPGAEGEDADATDSTSELVQTESGHRSLLKTAYGVDGASNGEPGESGGGGGGGGQAVSGKLGGGGGSGGVGGCGGERGFAGHPGGSSIAILVETTSIAVETGLLTTGDGGDGGDGGPGGEGGEGGDGGFGATGSEFGFVDNGGSGGNGGSGAAGGDGGDGSGGQGGAAVGIIHDVNSSVDTAPGPDVTFEVGDAGLGGDQGEDSEAPDGERTQVLAID